MPAVAVDVNETLLDLAALDPVFEELVGDGPFATAGIPAPAQA